MVEVTVVVVVVVAAPFFPKIRLKKSPIESKNLLMPDFPTPATFDELVESSLPCPIRLDGVVDGSCPGRGNSIPSKFIVLENRIFGRIRRAKSVAFVLQTISLIFNRVVKKVMPVG